MLFNKNLEDRIHIDITVLLGVYGDGEFENVLRSTVTI